MNGREDQIVFVEEWNAGLVAGGIRRIKREFGQKPFAARIGRRDLSKLDEIILPDGSILVDAFQMRRIPAADEVEFGGPAC